MSTSLRFLLQSDLKLVSDPVKFHPEQLCRTLALYAVGRSQWLSTRGEIYMSTNTLRCLKKFLQCNLHLNRYLRQNSNSSLSNLQRCAEELNSAFPHYQRWVIHQLSLRRSSLLHGSDAEKQQAFLLVQPLERFGQTPHEKLALKHTGCRSLIEFTAHYTQRRMRDEGIFSEEGFARFYSLLAAHQLAHYCRLG